MMVLATTAVVLRFYARYLSAAALRWDDWTILLALVKLYIFARIGVVDIVSRSLTGALPVITGARPYMVDSVVTQWLTVVLWASKSTSVLTRDGNSEVDGWKNQFADMARRDFPCAPNLIFLFCRLHKDFAHTAILSHLRRRAPVPHCARSRLGHCRYVLYCEWYRCYIRVSSLLLLLG